MYFSRVNTYTVSSALYSGGEQRLTRPCPKHFVLHLAELSLAQERLFISDAVQHWPGNTPEIFLKLWVMLETKSHFYHPLPAADNHILSADIMALFLSCAWKMLLSRSFSCPR